MPEVSALDFTQNSESGQLDVDGETKDLLKSLGVCCACSFLCMEKGKLRVLGGIANGLALQFDSIPVNVVAVSQQQIAERPRRFGDRPPRT